MNFLIRTADTLASNFVPFYKWGKPIVMGGAQGNLKATLLQTAAQVGYHGYIVPIVGEAVFSIPPVRNAILGAGEHLAEQAGKATQSWVTKSITTAVSEELQKDPRATDDIKDRVQNIVKATTGQMIETNNTAHMKHLANQMTIRLIGSCVQSQVAGQTTGRLLNMPAAPLAETAFYSLLLNAINLYCAPRISTSDEDIETLKTDLLNQLLENIKDPSRPISPEFQNCLNSVFSKVAETIVDHPTTDLIALKEALAKAAIEKAVVVEAAKPELTPEQAQKSLLSRISTGFRNFLSAIIQCLTNLLFRKKEEESAVTKLKLL